MATSAHALATGESTSATAPTAQHPSPIASISTVDAASTTAPIPADLEVRARLAEQIIGFRIMKQTEIAPGWWGQPVEVGETGSATVAMTFCDRENAVTLDPNRSKRIQYFAEPIYAEPEPMSENDRLAHEKASHVRRTGPAALRLRTAARAAGYNPDDKAALAALACVAGVDTSRLADAFTGRAPLDRVTRLRITRAIGVRGL